MLRDRLPPQDIEAEEAVIGSLLIDNAAFLKVAAFLKPEDFASERTRVCYEACQALFDRSAAINQVTVANQIGLKGQLENIGGAAYLTHVLLKVPTSAHIEHYARIVQRTALMRRLIDAADGIASIGYDASPDVEASLTHAEDLLFKLRIGKGDRGFIQLKKILDEYLAEKTERANRPDAPSFIPTGFFDLDKLLGGLQRSDLIILAARPGLGKSALALNIAYHAAKQGGANVAVFSLEMGKEQLVDRLISGITKIDTGRLRQFRQGQGGFSEEDALMAAIGELSEVPIWIDDTPMSTVVEMRSKARRLHMEEGLDLIIVDYLQLMGGGGGGYSNNRVQEVSEISRSLKGMARDLDVPVLALSQLSRAVENRPNHRPQLSDLRESGSIEQDADIVMFIYREDQNMKEDEWERQFPDKPYPQGIAEIIVSKHRHGPPGSIKLFFDQRTTSFKNAALGR